MAVALTYQVANFSKASNRQAFFSPVGVSFLHFGHSSKRTWSEALQYRQTILNAPFIDLRAIGHFRLMVSASRRPADVNADHFAQQVRHLFRGRGDVVVVRFPHVLEPGL